MIPIIEFLTSTVGRYVIGGVGVLALFLAFKSHEQHKGAAKAVAKIEKATTHVIKKGDDAANRSRDPGAKRVLDPYTRD
jgi:hypothetical protein